MRRLLINISTIILIIIYGNACDFEENVARVGNLKITKQEYLKALETRYSKRDSYADLDYQAKLEILDNLTERKLKINEAYAQGVDQDSQVIDELNNYRERLVSSRYYERTIIDRLVGADAVDQFIENQRVEVNGAHILIAHKNVNSKVTRNKNDAEALARQLLEMLESGASFDSLVQKYSDDQAGKNNNGALGWFTWGAMVGPFQDAIWQMKVGEISGPVETKFGFHIIRLDERRERKDYTPPQTEEELYYIKRRLFQVYADSARVLWEKQREYLNEKYNYLIFKPQIIAAAALITEKMQDGNIKPENFSAAEKSMVLAKWDGGAISINTLIKRNKDRILRVLVNYKNPQFLERDVGNVSTVELVVHDAEKTGIADDEFISTMVDEFMENKLYQEIEQKATDSVAEISEAEAYEYYQAHTEKFMKPAEIELWEIFVKDEAVAQKIKKNLDGGANFQRMVQKYSEDKPIKARKGYLGFRSQGARGSVSRDAFVKGPGGQIGGPVKYRNGWVVYQTGQLKKEEVREFKNVKNRAKSLLRRERLRDLRVKWMDELKEKYPVEINEELVKSI
jgi:parvulin-like peptidyl-prolyl isomerase